MYPRPDSPPPRAPTPEVDFAPLPVRSRFQSSSSSSSAAAARARNQLSPPRTLRSVRSVDAFNRTKRSFPAHDARPRKIKSHGTLHDASSPPSSPRSTASSSSSSTSVSSRRSHRSLSQAVPYRSPPASPNLMASPPPVPPIPAFALDAHPAPKPAKAKAAKRAQPQPLPEPESIAHLLGRPIVSRKTSFRDVRQAGLTCASFFHLRNGTRHTPTATAV
ncbi:hypothetical protein HDZ31DRAFT_31452 [Schizophyllum fasciatum]